MDKQILFNQINIHLLQDEVPALYINSISDCSIFKEYPFDMLDRLKYTMQSKKYHPEGSVWNHTMLVIDEAAKVKHKSNNKRVFMWAALLHDIGKPDTTKKKGDKITSYNHEKVGSEMTYKFLREFTQDNLFIDKTAMLILWHMQILHVVKGLPFADIETMKQQTDISEVALLGFCDRLGRLNVDREKEAENIRIFIEKCNK